MNEGGELLSNLAQELKVEVDKLSEVTLWLGSKMLEVNWLMLVQVLHHI